MTLQRHLIPALLLPGLAAPAAWASAQSPSAYDKVWGYATLYDNADNSVVQKIALSGRAQYEGYAFDADQGDDDDALWRRFRFGFKAQMFDNWGLHIEGDWNFNNSLDDSYNRLTDANISWSPNQQTKVKLLKHSAGFTLDGATSSKRLLTLQRNNVTNNLWFTAEYFTGASVSGSTDSNWIYKAGIFSSDGNEELSDFDAAYFTLLSLGRKLDNGMLRIDYVYNDKHEEANTRDFSQVVSLVSDWKMGAWGLRTDLSAGDGYYGQSDIWGLALMPYYDFNDTFQLVGRYTYMDSRDDNGLRLGRYESSIVSGRGDEYNELYAGFNVFFYGHKLKWQTGLQYASMDDSADDGGEYDGWGVTTGLRVSW